MHKSKGVNELMSKKTIISIHMPNQVFGSFCLVFHRIFFYNMLIPNTQVKMFSAQIILRNAELKEVKNDCIIVAFNTPVYTVTQLRIN